MVVVVVVISVVVVAVVVVVLVLVLVLVVAVVVVVVERRNFLRKAGEGREFSKVIRDSDWMGREVSEPQNG